LKTAHRADFKPVKTITEQVPKKNHTSPKTETRSRFWAESRPQEGGDWGLAAPSRRESDRRKRRVRPKAWAPRL